MHEFRLLQILQVAGVPTPAPLHLGTGGTILPTPWLLQSFVDGDTTDVPADLDEWVDSGPRGGSAGEVVAAAIAAVFLPCYRIPIL